MTRNAESAPVTYLKAKLGVLRERLDVVGIQGTTVGTTFLTGKSIAGENFKTPQPHLNRATNEPVFRSDTALPVRCLVSTVGASLARDAAKASRLASIAMSKKVFVTKLANTLHLSHLRERGLLLVDAFADGLAVARAIVTFSASTGWIDPDSILAGRARSEVASFHETKNSVLASHIQPWAFI